MKRFITSILYIKLVIAQMTGSINGTVVDRNTQDPLTGVNVQIEELGIGTITNSVGYYSLDSIPIGTRHISFSTIGYKKRVFLNFPISAARPINLNVELDIDPIQLIEVEVSGKVFGKTSESILSSMDINQVEFKSDPGSARDIQRAVQSSPSVTQLGDHVNEVIVRGGGPGENLFVMDNIKIANPNHFGIEGNGGGGFSLVNALFVKNIEFTPGAYSARYGDKASSATIVDLREGLRTNYEFDVDVSMAGANFKIEGPINKGHGSFIFASIWSYFDNIITNVGLTSVPHFNHQQLKLVYDINPNNKIILNSIVGKDRISVEADRVNESYYGVTNFKYKNSIALGGMTLKTLLGEQGYGLTTFSYSWQRMLIDLFDFDLESYPWFKRDNSTTEVTLKSEWFIRTPVGKIDAGLSLENIKYDYMEWLNADITFKYDTTYWFNGGWNLPDTLNLPEVIHPIYYHPTIRNDVITNYQKLGFFVQYKQTLKNKLELTLGSRIDYFDGTNKLVFSPRLNLEYMFNPSNTLHLACARHYQFPENFMILKDKINSTLNTEYSDQAVIGYEHFFADDFRAMAEIYYKKYNDVYTYYYWSNKPERYPDPLEHLFQWENNGTKENYGLELLLHKKLSRNWHGVLSYSYNHSSAKDVRTYNYVPDPNSFLNDGKWYPWDYDIRNKLIFTGGWKKKLYETKWYIRLNEKKFIKYLMPIIPLGDELEFSLRYSFTSGKPFTEKTYYPEYYDWYYSDDVQWNNSRYPYYSRLDFRLLKRHYYKNINITIYVNFINVFNKNNVLGLVYNPNGTKDYVWHFNTLPIGGINIEF